MDRPLSTVRNPTSDELARLYRLQVSELEDFAMFLVSLEGKVVSWNKGVQTVFGYPEEEWIGQDASLIFTEEDRAAGVPRAEMRRATTEGKAADIRWHVRKDGARIYMTGILKALHDRAGNLIGYSKITLDDTARKRLEDALTQSNADLQQFAFVASHDLQEPLRTITNIAELLRRRYGGRLDIEVEQFIGMIADAARRMSTLTRDLLAYSQLANADGLAASVHLDEDLETAISLLRMSIEETGTTVTHDALPTVEVERGQMVRVFQNLIGNAIKFRKQNEAPRIHVSAERRDMEWVIRVRDNGIGFPPSQSAIIFAPFKRLHGAEYPGSGIGLAACKRIVERSGGRIGAESDPGLGSTFWFTVPAGKE